MLKCHSVKCQSFFVVFLVAKLEKKFICKRRFYKNAQTLILVIGASVGDKKTFDITYSQIQHRSIYAFRSSADYFHHQVFSQSNMRFFEFAQNGLFIIDSIEWFFYELKHSLCILKYIFRFGLLQIRNKYRYIHCTGNWIAAINNNNNLFNDYVIHIHWE